jgi:hypothetical protein
MTGPAKCYFCGEPVDEEMLCHGCGHYICGDCDNEAEWGTHDPEAHRDDDDEGYEE